MKLRDLLPRVTLRKGHTIDGNEKLDAHRLHTHAHNAIRGKEELRPQRGNVKAEAAERLDNPFCVDLRLLHPDIEIAGVRARLRRSHR